jgi:hypothetical protein
MSQLEREVAGPGRDLEHAAARPDALGDEPGAPAVAAHVAAGFSDRDAARAGYHLNNFVTEFVADEARLATAAEAAGRSRAEVLAEAREQLRALPADEYPLLVRVAEHVTDDDADAVFQFGLDAWIAGLGQLLERR